MPTPNESDVLESAITLVEATLALNILAAHKRDVINGLLWSITQARGKYTTRFRSTAAVNALRARSSSTSTSLPAKHLPMRSCANRTEQENSSAAPSGAWSPLTSTDGSRQVTREQPHLRGWERYTAAGIEIIDTDETSPPRPALAEYLHLTIGRQS